MPARMAEVRTAEGAGSGTCPYAWTNHAVSSKPVQLLRCSPETEVMLTAGQPAAVAGREDRGATRAIRIFDDRINGTVRLSAPSSRCRSASTAATRTRSLLRKPTVKSNPFPSPRIAVESHTATTSQPGNVCVCSNRSECGVVKYWAPSGHTTARTLVSSPRSVTAAPASLSRRPGCCPGPHRPTVLRVCPSGCGTG
jgi:hypothetical protein